jgi:uncharacterized protein (TIGR03382 family)
MTTWVIPWMLAATAGGAPAAVRYDGDRLVRAWPRDAAELTALLDLASDVWTERVGVGPLDVRVAARDMPALDVSGIAYEVRIADVQAAVDAEASRLGLGIASAPGALPASAQSPEWFADFRDLPAIETFVDTLAADHPGLVAIEAVGESLEGRPIRALRIGTPAPGKTGVLYTGTMHAREWLSPMVTTCIADAIASRAGSDPRIDDILQSVVLFVVPVLNPDGYAYSWSGDRYWRKNVRDGHGVDLNRNFGYAWGGDGASADPWAENYHGTGPFSEPESAALRDFAVAHPELVAHIDVHAYANLVIHPWGYGYDTAPDEPVLASLASDMAGAMTDATGAIYQPIQGADFYPAAGAVDDWSYGERGMMAFTIELRGNDFVVPPSFIEPACDETLEAALVLAEWAALGADPEVPPGGDDDTEGGGGDHGPGPSAGESTAGDAAATGDADPEDTGGEADSEGDAPAAGDLDAALPWDYGGEGSGCTCTSDPHTPGSAFVAALVLALRRRRDQGT